jgi:hypothetical protein
VRYTGNQDEITVVLVKGIKVAVVGFSPYAGANNLNDLPHARTVIGHSPHVLRGMEFYRGKLTAYSLGNFAGGGGTLSGQGVLKYGGILRVTLAADGTYAGGCFDSTYLNPAGLPTRDQANERDRDLVAELTGADFAGTGAGIGADGAITPPA